MFSFNIGSSKGTVHPEGILYTVNIGILFHRTGVSGKEGAMQLASQALMKKSTDRSLHYKGNTIIETAPETDETLQQVGADMHTLCQLALP